ncbi:MAG TPA: glycosyltransferase [Gemmatimonadales bacterium]|nr:glycosyltransferase [Gemmatimonadales bacterium]
MISPLEAQAFESTLAPDRTVRRRRLVLVSYHHSSDGAIGGMRWSGLTKYLARHGWTSWIVTAAAATGHPNVISCPRRPTLNDAYRRLRARNDSSAGSDAPESAGELAGEPRSGVGILGRLRLEAAALLAIPDQGRGWILRAARAARKTITEVWPDAVISTGPPHSAHVAAWLATRGTGVRRYVDFRDPWAGPTTAAWLKFPEHRSLVWRAWTETLEPMIVRSAAGVLCNTPEFAAALGGIYPEIPVHCVSNGVDLDLLPPRETERLPGLALSYVGTLYGGRTLRPILAALRLFLDRHPNADASLRIAGHVDAQSLARLEAEIGELRLRAVVHILGVLSRAAALSLAGRSGLSIVLAQGQELQVPAKLYELVAMQVPTVAIAEPESATFNAAQRLAAWAVAPDDIRTLVRVFEGAAAHDIVASARQAARTDVSYERLAGELNEVLR